MPAKLFLYVLLSYSIISSSACRKNPVSQTPDPIPAPSVETAYPVLTPVTFEVNEAIGGYYKALPVEYTTSDNAYPLLVFIHGGGGYGNGQLDLPVLLNEGIPQLLDEKIIPDAFTVKGEEYSFIHLAPQFTRQPSIEEVHSFISYAKAEFNVDSSRIYLAGMSNGGKIICNLAASYPTLFAAIVPMAGISDTARLVEKCSALAQANLPIWVFHNDKDELASIDFTSNFVSLINSFEPDISPKFTIFSSMGLLGHDAWTRAVDPAYKEDGRNIYEWMLQYRRATD